MAYKSKNIRQKIKSNDDANRSWEALGISRNEVEWRRRLAHWQQDKQVVGVEEDTEKLLKEFVLDETTRNLSVATIVGIAGIGKSCLARHLFNHIAVVDRFDCRLWVFVSTEFNPREVIKELLQQLSVGITELREVLNFIDKATLSQVMWRLRQHLKGKRFLVVLDDVWEDKHWQFLATLFPREEKASRLLLTSRDWVPRMNAPYIHEMKLLDAEKSWQLLLNKAFVEGLQVEHLHDFEIIGREILKKCSGLPLAIVVIGGQLIDRNPCTEKWKKVLELTNFNLPEMY